jgi:hypothetical protein
MWRYIQSRLPVILFAGPDWNLHHVLRGGKHADKFLIVGAGRVIGHVKI